jgi:hypothetical protein
MDYILVPLQPGVRHLELPLNFNYFSFPLQLKNKFFFVRLNKSNRKYINKNFEAEIILNKIKINSQFITYQIHR